MKVTVTRAFDLPTLALVALADPRQTWRCLRGKHAWAHVTDAEERATVRVVCEHCWALGRVEEPPTQGA